MALCDLGASINLMPVAIYKWLGLETPKPTFMWLLISDYSVEQHVGIPYYVLGNVANFLFLVAIVILYYKVHFKVPIILVKPFLSTERVFMDMKIKKIKFRINDEKVNIEVCQSTKQTKEIIWYLLLML